MNGAVTIVGNGNDVLIDSEKAKAVFCGICSDYLLTAKELVVNVVDQESIVLINKSHLQHDYPTDIITFDYNRGKRVVGELYICRPFIESSAKEFHVSVETEFARVFIHGILHLVGEDDQSTDQVERMRSQEDYYLNKFFS
jgi:rRNA maturation RNase YbeY